MTRVNAQISVSLDGFYSGPQHLDAGFHRVTRWAIDTRAWRRRTGLEGGHDNASSRLIAEMWEETGAHVMGRQMFDLGEVPWGPTPPFHAPVFVVTHRAREPLVKEGGTTFTFVTDGIEIAIEQARAAAGGRAVAIAGGGSLLRQAVRAGLVDRLELHVAPVLLGAGMRLFDAWGDDAIELAPNRVVDAPDITHVRYEIKGPGIRAVDDRGQKLQAVTKE